MRRSVLLLLALLATVGFVAGCGTSGGDDASPTTTAGKASSSSTSDGSSDTTEPSDATTSGSTETTATTKGHGAAPTLAELQAILPKASDIGTGYTLQGDDSSDDSSDETDKQLEEACPGISKLEFLGQGQSDGSTATANFATEDDREVDVELDPTPTHLTADNVDQIVSTLDGCKDVKVSDDSSGFSIQMSISARREDGYGDFGMRMDMQATVSAMGLEIPLTFAGHAFSVDGVGVYVSATSGVDDSGNDIRPIPYDADILDSVSSLMEDRVGAL